MRDFFTRRGVCHECANPPWGDASSCGHIRFLVEQQRKPHPIGVILGSQVCKMALDHFACLVLVSVHVMTQHAVGVRIGRRHVRAVFYTKVKQQGTITSDFAATRAPMLSLLLQRNISVELKCDDKKKRISVYTTPNISLLDYLQSWYQGVCHVSVAESSSESCDGNLHGRKVARKKVGK